MMPRQTIEAVAVDMRLHERAAYREGFCLVCGIDEAGRGPLAGPVVAGAVILPKSVRLSGITDSKKLTPQQREDFFEKIQARALAIGIGVVENGEIDRINILQATFRAMAGAVSQLPLAPDFLLIDGPYKLPVSIGQKGIVRGDSQSISIAAASIIAKVYRDRLMCRFHEEFPQYGFDTHKGYGTARHYEALQKFGPCPLHRVTFRGVLPGAECGGRVDGCEEPL
ncbi:MAG: ribonuclease HII [Syntrophobacteraceae bacterium]|nr:ribonuclease HII [Syntrophobacteraceae bacterium]